MHSNKRFKKLTMKKELKLLVFILFLMPLGVAILGTGCEKDEYSHDSIIGEWKWIYSTGGVVGTTYPEKGQKVIWKFSKDSTLVVTENGKTTFESDFHISGDTLKYNRGTDLEYKVNITDDTLALNFIEDGMDDFYKRVN